MQYKYKIIILYKLIIISLLFALWGSNIAPESKNFLLFLSKPEAPLR